MRQGIWFAAGIGAGVYAMVRARRVAEAFTPDGARDRLSGVRVGARMLAEEFSTSSAERELELRERFGLVPHGVPELTPGASDAPSAGTISASGEASPSGPPRPASPSSPQEGTD
ncbi:DUF6167 family protein [Nocardioides zeae]|uniref:DUF6167 family protein n=1 Tax=Nocardioides imazamoxiresistens TaxID=3231893 RepID=A0ABU3Q0N5_9ACTN|nr:DUF6167 family protein [Nocardioides zeae]MDT9594612.1 DUF6167 family protein [Nocardioides zeae]